MEKDMPTLYMLIGVPASGKSTWLAKQDLSNASVLSTDNYIEAAAKTFGKTYNDVFKDEIKNATSNMDILLIDAIAMNDDIYWDQTNLTIKSRKGKLMRIPDGYRKVAVVFPTPDKKEWERRLNSRPGKTIPKNILANMVNSLEMPDKSEGFDEIVVVK